MADADSGKSKVKIDKGEVEGKNVRCWGSVLQYGKRSIWLFERVDCQVVADECKDEFIKLLANIRDLAHGQDSLFPGNRMPAFCIMNQRDMLMDL